MIMRELVNRFCRFMLALMGFAAVDGCNIVADMYGPLPAPEYGVPNVDFRVSGMVRDSQTKQPVKGIEVGYFHHLNGPGTVYTDDSGRFVVEAEQFASSKTELTFADVDGPANGEYETSVVEFTMEKVEDSDSAWNEGTYAADNVVVELDPVTKE